MNKEEEAMVRELRKELALSKNEASWLDQLADYLRNQITTGVSREDDDEEMDANDLHAEFVENRKNILDRYK